VENKREGVDPSGGKGGKPSAGGSGPCLALGGEKDKSSLNKGEGGNVLRHHQKEREGTPKKVC